MKTATRIATVALAAAALSGCQSISDFFAFKGKDRSQAPTATAAVFGSEELEQGRLALKAGYPARAIELFRLAALNEEVAPDAFNGLGVAYAKLGRADLAERYFKTALTLDSSNPRYAANLARFYESPLGQSKRALAMREAEAAATLARAADAAEAEGLLDAGDDAAQSAALSAGDISAVTVSRGGNRELRLTTSPNAAQSAGALPSVSARQAKKESASDSLSLAVEDATAKAAVKKRRQAEIRLTGAGSENPEMRVRIGVMKPGSQGATRPRARVYPVRVALKPSAAAE